MASHTQRQVTRETDRLSRPIDRAMRFGRSHPAGRQAGKQADWQAGRQAGKQARRQAGRQAGQQAGRQSGSQAICRQVMSSKKVMSIWPNDYACVAVPL